MAKPESEYSQKLRDPRWQKLRLQVFERDEWTCQRCGDKESTLAVHHKRYQKGLDPWDYPADFLITVCEQCHQWEYQYRREAEELLLQGLRDCNFFVSDILCLVDSILSKGPLTGYDHA